MKYYVRTTGEREINYPDYFTVLLDTEYDACKSFVEQLKNIDDDCVIIEDDVTLCNNFKEIIEENIAKNKDLLINFFDDPRTKRPYPVIKGGYMFAWCQCLYIPNTVRVKLIVELEKICKIVRKNQTAEMIRAALVRLNLPYVSFHPNLVQHDDNGKSLIYGNIGMRRSIDFIDDIKK